MSLNVVTFLWIASSADFSWYRVFSPLNLPIRAILELFLLELQVCVGRFRSRRARAVKDTSTSVRVFFFIF